MKERQLYFGLFRRPTCGISYREQKMSYKIRYSCLSHIGKRRSINQDNYYCDGEYLKDTAGQADSPVKGCLKEHGPHLFAVFDGMGGEECGEKASLIAAECVSKYRIGSNPIEDLLGYCQDANEEILRYAADHNIASMGTTAAILVFGKKEIFLCNIGDSKVFRFDGESLEQISVDHYAAFYYGRKPPLSQNLGIPASEFVLEPYLAKGYYHDGDIYLLCSDGLTDMVSTEEICSILKGTSFENAADKMLNRALEGGGKDNITILLCMVEKKKSLFSRLWRGTDDTADR